MSSRILFGALLCLASVYAQANVVINKTRVVYNEASGEANVRLQNAGNDPVLVQTWLNTLASDGKPSDSAVPFVMNPAVARIDADKTQTVRIFRTDDTLPKSRESLFWFNLLEVPLKPSAKAGEIGNSLQFSFRTEIKLFYRPAGLTGSSEQAIENLAFLLKPSEQGGLALWVDNEAPYFITLRDVEIRQSKNGPIIGVAEVPNEGLLGPSEKRLMTVLWTKPAQAGSYVDYTAINDQGGDLNQQKPITVRSLHAQ